MTDRARPDEERPFAPEAAARAAGLRHAATTAARLPTGGGRAAPHAPRTRFNTTLVPDPEQQQASYEACRRGEVPEHPPVGMQIPTVMDPSLAPPGFHVATTYGFFFPCDAPREERGKLREEMAERTLDRLSEFLPDLRECIVGRLLVPGSAHATPIPGLWLCGAACHPGPGVTFLPGYGAACEVAQALATAGPWSALHAE